ncbi:MAG: hypothetical protein LBK95_06570 [Bifidobacteriaceae bacterium]|jgi:hypothetical protein|nr:hypothetical protein [Bifidobacteriaceae bacterium]
MAARFKARRLLGIIALSVFGGGVGAGCGGPDDSSPFDGALELDGRDVALTDIVQAPLAPDGTAFTVSAPGAGDIFLLGTRKDREALEVSACSVGDQPFDVASVKVMNLPNPRGDAKSDESTFFTFGRASVTEAADYSVRCELPDVRELLVAYIPG